MKKILMMLVLAGAITNLMADDFSDSTDYPVATGIKNVSGINLPNVDVKYEYGMAKDIIGQAGLSVYKAKRNTAYHDRGPINTATIRQGYAINDCRLTYDKTWGKYSYTGLGGSEHSVGLNIEDQRPKILGFRVTWDDGAKIEYPVTGGTFSHAGLADPNIDRVKFWHFLILPPELDQAGAPKLYHGKPCLRFVQVPELVMSGGMVTRDGWIIRGDNGRVVKEDNQAIFMDPPAGKNATVDTNGKLARDTGGNVVWQ